MEGGFEAKFFDFVLSDRISIKLSLHRTLILMNIIQLLSKRRYESHRHMVKLKEKHRNN